MMKWEDITDEARKATEQALTDLLTENRKISGDQLSIRLQDPAYLEKKSQQRKRYCGEEAFRQMKRREAKRRKMHSDRRNIGHCAETKNRSLTIGRSFYSGNPFCRNEGFAD